MATAVAAPVDAAPGAQLKRLSFVPEVAEKGVHMASAAYATTKAHLPEAVKPKVAQLEERVSSLSAPYVARAQDTSSDLLRAVDSKVDTAVTQAAEMYAANQTYLQQQLEKQKQFHAANLESYRTAREQYLKKVEDSVEFLKQHGLTGAAKAAVDEVGARLAEAKKLPGYVLHQVQEALDRLLAFPPVHKLLEAAQPQLQAAWGTYSKYHESLVASPRYKQTYDLTLQVLNRLQATMLYQTARKRLYPMVQGYADPAYEKVVSSDYYRRALEHLRPKVA